MQYLSFLFLKRNTTYGIFNSLCHGFCIPTLTVGRSPKNKYLSKKELTITANNTKLNVTVGRSPYEKSWQKHTP